MLRIFHHYLLSGLQPIRELFFHHYHNQTNLNKSLEQPSQLGLKLIYKMPWMEALVGQDKQEFLQTFEHISKSRTT